MKRDEAKLTAYALGELSAQEAAIVEGWMEQDPELRAFVEEVRATGALLEQGFALKVAPLLTVEQRATIAVQAATRPSQRSSPRPTGSSNWMALATAAGLLGAVGLWIAAWKGEDRSEVVVATRLDRPSPNYLQALQGMGYASSETSVGLHVEHEKEDAPDVFYAALSGSTPGLQAVDINGFGSSRDVEGLEWRGLDSVVAVDGEGAAGPPSAGFFFDEGGEGSFRKRAENFFGRGEATNGAKARVMTVQPSADPKGWAGQPVYGLKRATTDLEAQLRHLAGESAQVEVPAITVTGGQVPRFSASTTAGLALELTEADPAWNCDPIPVDELYWSYYKPDDVPSPGSEAYQRLVENTFQDPRKDPLSTFSIDVDTASYANVRRFLNQGQLPPRDAVRLEEMVNYFRYDYGQPEGDEPFSVDVEVGTCPWNPSNRLLRVGLQGKLPPKSERKRANLVFLLDVSGSMNEPSKLPLLKNSLRLLVQNLTEDDTVAIVTYAGQAGLHLQRTHGANREALDASIDALSAGGSTNGESGIQLAYKLASEGFIEGGINRVMLGTDGDFNVGQSSDDAMEKLIVEKAKSGVHLTVLGFGGGNLKDSKLELISGKGNGNYAYIDSLREAKRVLVDELAGTLETIAKDVKLQVDFNPGQVAAYRLIGYENRALAAQDFTDDSKDAGEIGAGHRVTALYEIVPTGGVTFGVEPSKYVAAAPDPDVEVSDELCEVRLRFKQPDGDVSRERRVAVKDEGKVFARLSDDTRFAAAVAAFGMVLRGSPHRGEATPKKVAGWAMLALGDDEGGYRTELVELVLKASMLGLR